MAVTYIPTKNGAGYVVLCLAADTKPTSTTPGSLLETNTGTIYYPDGGGGWTATSSGGASRSTASVTTASVANNANTTGTITMAKSTLVYKVVVSELCRVRLYGTAAGQSADLSRPVTDAADWNVTLLVELLLDDVSLQTFKMQPPAIVENQDTVVVSDIYYTITNLSGITTTIDLDVTFLTLET